MATLRARSSGILLHLSSLPGPHGIGDLGPSARRFADFSAASGQTWWQMLPIVPPDCTNCPYTALSAFAGSPLFISLDKLAEAGFLAPGDTGPSGEFQPGRVEYAAVRRFKEERLERAFSAFERRGGSEERARFEGFCADNAWWLSDFALFCALKERHGGAVWTQWDPGLRSREPAALARVRGELDARIRYHQFLQYQFFLQWSGLREHCRSLGLGLMGDVPIYVAHDSAEVWAEPELFWLEPDGRPTIISGVPPDCFSETGQRWGTPLYRWEEHKSRGYEWWIRRLKLTFERFDAARLDHFIGFQRYWEVPASEPTARRGRWVDGPGRNFFEKVLAALGPLELVAEDLGLVTPEVLALRDQFDFPGMRVLQFAFGGDPATNSHLPHHHPRRCVVYTGTHDNDTAVAWFRGLGREERRSVLRYLASDGRAIHWAMIRMAFMSVADTAIVPAQDLLGLGTEARINLPGSERGNWEWRLAPGALSERIGQRLLNLTEVYGRLRSA